MYSLPGKCFEVCIHDFHRNFTSSRTVFLRFYFFFELIQHFHRATVGRQSVCTTMSCSSVFANGTGHRTSKTKWDMFQRGRNLTITGEVALLYLFYTALT